MIRTALRKVVALTLMVMIVMLFTFSAYGEEKGKINTYNIRVSVSDSKVYKVTEEVEVEFLSGSHVIEKKIPMEGLKIKNLESKTHNAELKMEGLDYIIRVGSDDISKRSKESMKFTYEIDAYDSEKISGDTFDLVLLSEGLGFTITDFKAHLSFPKEFSEKNIKLKTCSGKSLDKSYKTAVNNNAIDITAENVTAEKGMKCYIEMPDAYWNQAATFDYMEYIILGIFVIIPLLICMFWLAGGRDPKRKKVESYYPPNQMTPMEMGYVIDGHIDYQDAASMIIYYAQKGYLRIEEYASGKIMIYKLMEIPRTEKSFAITLFNRLFDGRERFTIEEIDWKFTDAYNKSRKDLRHYYTGSRRLFTRKSKMLRGIGIFLSVVPASAAVIAAALFKIQMREMLIALPVIVFILAGGFIITKAYDKKFVISFGSRMRKYVFGILLLLAANGAAAYYVTKVFGFQYGIGLLVSAGISMFFIMLLKARTLDSTELLNQINGLRAFIKRGDQNTCSVMNQKNPNYYYEILAYAYAMDLMPKWTRLFSKSKMSAPSWYVPFGTIKEEKKEIPAEDETKVELKLEGEKPEPIEGEVPKELNAPKAENAEIVPVKEEEQPKKKGFLAQLTAKTGIAGIQPKVAVAPSFNLDSFSKTLKGEIDRLADGVRERNGK